MSIVDNTQEHDWDDAQEWELNQLAGDEDEEELEDDSDEAGDPSLAGEENYE